MRKHLGVGLLISLPLVGWCASVKWGVAYAYTSFFDEQILRIEQWDEQPYLDTALLIGLDRSGGYLSLIANPGGSDLLVESGKWVLSWAGDLVAAEAMRKSVICFADDPCGEGFADATEVGIPLNVRGMNYLKFLVQDVNQYYDYLDGTRIESPDCYVGWVEYVVDNNGTITVMRSAVNLSGGPLIVGGGAIPEPTGGWLIAAGLALIGLCRRGCCLSVGGC